MNIRQALASDLTDSVGAASILSKRFDRAVSVDSIHQLVKQNKLRAFMFHNGEIVKRPPSTQTRGKDLLFLHADLHALPRPRKVGRPSQKALHQ